MSRFYLKKDLHLIKIGIISSEKMNLYQLLSSLVLGKRFIIQTAILVLRFNPVHFAAEISMFRALRIGINNQF